VGETRVEAAARELEGAWEGLGAAREGLEAALAVAERAIVVEVLGVLGAVEVGIMEMPMTLATMPVPVHP